MSISAVNIAVSDPFGVVGDTEMPGLVLALNPDEAQRHLARRLRRLAGEGGSVKLSEIRVTRYKPKQRCLIEYTVLIEKPDTTMEMLVLIGKVRAEHRARISNRLLGWLRHAGFGADSADGISVPEPLGVIKDLQMWLQRKVPGKMATQLLAGPDGIMLAGRIAEAATKLHRASVPTRRHHTMADELRILRKRLPVVATALGAERIDRLLDAAERLGANVPEPIPCGIHRDFYADQVIVDGGHLYLIDFDLYCVGDPALDIGNFLGHITEQSLRMFGDPAALSEIEEALMGRFLELSGEALRFSVNAYAVLTLVRHIYLSTLKPERRPFTRSLLELCEERLGVKSGSSYARAAMVNNIA